MSREDPAARFQTRRRIVRGVDRPPRRPAPLPAQSQATLPTQPSAPRVPRFKVAHVGGLRRPWRQGPRRPPPRVLMLRPQPRQQQRHRAYAANCCARGAPPPPVAAPGNTWRSPRPAKACCSSPPSSWGCSAAGSLYAQQSAPHNRQRRRLALQRIRRPRLRPRLRWHRRSGLAPGAPPADTASCRPLPPGRRVPPPTAQSPSPANAPRPSPRVS